MKIAMIASEANPLVKSGGLADVVHALSSELNRLDNEAIIILPYYKKIKENTSYKPEFIGDFSLFMSWRKQYCGVFKLNLGNIVYYLLDNEFYFKRDNLYGYGDDGERFAFFSLAAIESLKIVGFKPDIIHVHDWQAGMIPCLLKERYKKDDFYKSIHSVLTIHNPAFKGMLDKYYLNNFYGLSDELFYNGKVRFEGMISTLKSAIVYADALSTVSPTHRNELLSYQTSHGFNYVLELRKDDFVGIVNGIDTVEFNPECDDLIAAKYTAKAFKIAKKENKRKLASLVHITYKDEPIFGLVSRLSWQKGIKLINEIIPSLIQKGAKIVLLGSGEEELEAEIQVLRSRYPNDVGIYIGYNDSLAHAIYAGSDFFLMPSLFEPCGIGQLIAQRYGSLPIVRKTGGLADTVVGYDGGNEKNATGIAFSDFDILGLRYATDLAFSLFENKKALSTIIKNAMELDLSWNKSANAYLDLYRKALSK